MDNNQVVNKRHGGPRLGAGRPSLERKVLRDTKWFAARGVSPLTAYEILQHCTSESKVWMRLLNSEDDRVVLQAMVFLTTMRDGKPAQSINVTSQSITVQLKDIESARAIIREIRQAAADSPSLGQGSPLLVDAPLPAVSTGNVLTEQELAVGDVVNSGEVMSLMVSEDEGGI